MARKAGAVTTTWLTAIILQWNAAGWSPSLALTPRRGRQGGGSCAPHRTSPDGGVVNVIALELEGGSVRSINSIVNPDKLRHLGPVADLGDLLAGGPSG